MSGWTFRRRIRIAPGVFLNVGKRGVSASARLGRATVSTTGRASLRVARGLSYRFGRRER